MTDTVTYRITLSSLAFKSRQYTVAGRMAAGNNCEVDPYDVKDAVRQAKNLAELDYMAIVVAPSVVKVEIRRTARGVWVELVSAFRIQPGTKVRTWGGGAYAQVVFGNWRSNRDGSQDFYTNRGRRMGCYNAHDVFEVLPDNAAV